jgi:tetratricopeptide (TPR) repeat protein
VSEQPEADQFAQGNYIAQAKDRSIAKVNVTNITYADVRPRPVDAESLQKALRELEKLPLEEIPAPASLPHASHMPVRRYNFFVGREANLKALAEDLKAAAEDREEAATVAVTGMGGVGKSQLVSEFVHRYGQYFLGGVFWLSFADAAVVPAEVAGCGGAGGMDLRADFRHLPLDDQVREVISTWQSALPRLLVFDNCEEQELLDQWRPPAGGCRVLATSRTEVWDPSLGVKVVALDVLSRKESLALLGKHRPDLPEDNPDLDAIAEELGDLPLAVELAGRYLARYRFEVTPGEYLRQLRSSELLRHPSLQKVKGISPTDHEMDVFRTLALSYERLDTADPTDSLAVAVLARAACFAPGEAIPRRLLLLSLDLLEGDPQAKLRAADAISRLAELGLLRAEESGALTLHRLLAAFVRSAVVGDAKAKPAVEEALLEIDGYFLYAGYSEPLVALLPHLRAVTDTAKDREDERAASLCLQLGQCLRMTGAYTEARPFFERVLEIRQKVLGEDHPDTAQSLNALANLLSDQGSYQEARSLYERALAIYEKVLGEDHPDTASSLNNLALLLEAQGFYQEARPLFQRALAIREKVLGEDHPDTAASLNNLALLLEAQGFYQEARPLFQRALVIREKVLGEDHPDTATSLNNLAILLFEQGNYQEARPLYERALAIQEKVLGEEHPYTAASVNNLATLLRDQGSYEEARPLYERALAILEKVLGEEHPHTKLVRQNLTMLDTQQKK